MCWQTLLVTGAASPCQRMLLLLVGPTATATAGLAAAASTSLPLAVQAVGLLSTAVGSVLTQLSRCTTQTAGKLYSSLVATRLNACALL